MEALAFPNRITVELTNRCNVSCTFCPRQSVPMELGDMDRSLFCKIIDEAEKHLPVKLVVFFRGESLLHPEFTQLIGYAKKKGVGPIQFATNALAMDDRMADAILEAEVDFISFSLDTIDERVYQESRLTGNLKQSMEHVKGLSAKCEAWKRAGKKVPTLQVSTIELDVYQDRQQEFIEYWQQYVDIVRVYYEHDDKGHFANPKVWEQLQMDSERKPCRKVFTDFLVYWNGDTALCNYDWRGQIKNRNVKEESIESIWNSPEYINIREMHNSSQFSDTIMCRDCQHWKIDYVPGGYLGRMYKKMDTKQS